jgi:hypothetical protein
MHGVHTPVRVTSGKVGSQFTHHSKYSIVGHHNISAKKWDVIPWAEKLYYDLDGDIV